MSDMKSNFQRSISYVHHYVVNYKERGVVKTLLLDITSDTLDKYYIDNKSLCKRIEEITGSSNIMLETICAID